MKSHELVMSYPRIGVKQALKSENTPRQSAVLILLFPDNDGWNIMLMKRNQYEGSHSGQVSLPGGKKEKEDLNLEHTALREAQEEIGIHLDKVSVLRSLSQLYIPPSNFIVTPYLAITKELPDFTPEAREVDRLITMPLSFLIKDDSLTEQKVQLSNSKARIKVKAFLYDNEIIWGATAMILQELKDLLKLAIAKNKNQC